MMASLACASSCLCTGPPHGVNSFSVNLQSSYSERKSFSNTSTLSGACSV